MPDSTQEEEWVHDTFLTALQISEALDIIRDDHEARASSRQLQLQRDMEVKSTSDEDTDATGFQVVDPNQPPKSI